MKVRGHITAVEDCGDQIKVSGQGYGVADASWRSWFPIVFSVASTQRNERTYHVGRKFVVTIEVEP